jgi:hypothetical protein
MLLIEKALRFFPFVRRLLNSTRFGPGYFLCFSGRATMYVTRPQITYRLHFTVFSDDVPLRITLFLELYHLHLLHTEDHSFF